MEPFELNKKVTLVSIKTSTFTRNNKPMYILEFKGKKDFFVENQTKVVLDLVTEKQLENFKISEEYKIGMLANVKD